MSLDTNDLEAKRPIGILNRQIGVDYPNVFAGLMKALLSYAMGNSVDGLAATVDATFSFKFQKRQLEPTELAWLLIRRAMAHAMAKLTVEAMHDRLQSLKLANGLVAQLDKVMDAAEVRLNSKFFDEPHELGLIAPVSISFRQWLEACGVASAEANCVVCRLPSYLTFALHNEWVENPEFYKILETKLKNDNSPFAFASTRERA